MLYVDLLLGFLCASALISEEYLTRNNKSRFPVFLILLVITLLKANGFVFSCCLLLLFFIKDVIRNKKYDFKTIFSKLMKYIIPILLILLTYAGWLVIFKFMFNENLSYTYNLIPESLSKNISNKLNLSFMLNYFNSLIVSIDNNILHSFISIPLFAFLILTFLIIYITDKKEKKYNIIESLLPYVVSYIVFFALTALSLFVMFTYYEASELASFSRYLAPINMALMLFCFYRLSYILGSNHKVKLFFVIIIMLVGFSNITYFVTDIKARRETQHTSEIRNNVFSIVNNNTKEDSKVFVINQTDEDSIMPLWYARYYCYPRVINSSSDAITWKIKVESNEWDLKDWGLTPKTFDEHIIEYNFDYVFMYSATQELYDALKDDFYGINDPEKYKLFKVKEISNDDILLVPVK